MVAPVSAQESGNWVRSLQFAEAPVAGEEVPVLVEIIPTFKGVTDHVRLEGVSLEEGGPLLVQALAGESAGLFVTRLTFPKPGLWLLSLIRVWIETFQDVEVLTVPVYVAAKPGMGTGAWMDPRAADVLRRWSSQVMGSGGRTPVNLADCVGKQHKWDRLGPEKIIIMKSCVGAP